MTARASASLDVKWKYTAPLVTPARWMISAIVAAWYPRVPMT